MDLINAALGLDDDFEPKVVTVEIVAATADVATVKTAAGYEAVLPITEWPAGRPWAAGDRFQALQLDAGPRPLVSVVRPEFIEALLIGLSPEVRSGQVRVMGVARAAGDRAKVAVAATEGNEGVDPVASCVGRGANRVKQLIADLGGERVDVVPWSPDPEQYLRNALMPAAVTTITITDNKLAEAAAPRHQMSAAVGGRGLNSALAGQLVGLNVTIVEAR